VTAHPQVEPPLSPATGVRDLDLDARTQPFDLPGPGRPCLLLHGFTGTPYEVRPLGEALARRGYRAVGPRLAGHASTAEALGRSNAAAWYQSALQALQALAPGPEARPVHLLGLSVGAMLALRLAAEFPERIATLTLLAPAARFQPAIRMAFRAFRHWPMHQLLPSIPKSGVGMVDREFASRAPALDRIPTRLAREVVATLDAGRAAARSVHLPTLIVYGGQDRTVSPEGVLALAHTLRPPPLKVVRLAESGHLLPLDVERERLFQEVGEFLAGRDGLRG
jgi:carboxylesterase